MWRELYCTIVQTGKLIILLYKLRSWLYYCTNSDVDYTVVQTGKLIILLYKLGSWLYYCTNWEVVLYYCTNLRSWLYYCLNYYNYHLIALTQKFDHPIVRTGTWIILLYEMRVLIILLYELGLISSYNADYVHFILFQLVFVSQSASRGPKKQDGSMPPCPSPPPRSKLPMMLLIKEPHFSCLFNLLQQLSSFCPNNSLTVRSNVDRFVLAWIHSLALPMIKLNFACSVVVACIPGLFIIG